MVNSCAKISHVNFTRDQVSSAVNRVAEVNAAATVAVSAAVGINNQFPSNTVLLSASNLSASNPGN